MIYDIYLYTRVRFALFIRIYIYILVYLCMKLFAHPYVRYVILLFFIAISAYLYSLNWTVLTSFSSAIIIILFFSITFSLYFISCYCLKRLRGGAGLPRREETVGKTETFCICSSLMCFYPCLLKTLNGNSSLKIWLQNITIAFVNINLTIIHKINGR